MGGRGPLTSLHLPPSTVAITLAARVALKARLYRCMPSSSLATTGMAVATAIASNATSMTRATRPELSERYLADITLTGGCGLNSRGHAAKRMAEPQVSTSGRRS
ncbi:hypothetical protein GCM10020219_078790 [Nonomuraea dietziae]